MANIDRDAADSLRRNAERSEEAAGGAARAAVALWRTQLDMALTLDDPAAIRDILTQRPVAWGDNNCGCGGGGASRWG